MTTAIIGIAFVAVFELFAACTVQNRAAASTTTAMMLATHIREASVPLSFDDPHPLHSTFGAETGETLATFDDVDDFNGQVFSPPIDAARQNITELSQYGQTVAVTPVDPDQPSGSGSQGSAVRVTVTITYQANAGAPVERVYTQSWLRMNQ